MKTTYIAIFSFLLVGYLITNSCKKEEVLETPRFFKPQVIGVDNSVDNQLTVSWLPSKGVIQYQIDLSVDSAFVNIEKSKTVDSSVSTLIISELKGATKYFIRIKAIATDSEYNSKDRVISAVTNSIFLNNPTFILDNSFITKWTVKGLPVTKVKVRLNSKDLQYPLVKEFDVTTAEALQGQKTVSGFKGETQYLIELYSGELIRGTGIVNTKPSIKNSIDLRDIDPLLRDKALNDTITKVPNGSVIVLKRGEIYNLTSTQSLNKSISFTSGYSFISEFATIKVAKNLVVAEGSNIGRIAFNDLNISGTSNGAYLLVIQLTSCKVDTISFNGCNISTFRGAIRLRGSEIVNNLFVNNCSIDSVSDYGFISLKDAATNIIKNISVKNSTVYRSRRFIAASKYLPNTAQTTTIENCTFYDAPYVGNNLVEFPTDITMQANVTIKNCIFSKAGSPPPAIPVAAFKYGTTISWDAGSSNYITNDFYFNGNITPSVYNGISTALFEEPAKFNFKIKDTGFSGKNTAGDPRWRN